MQIMTHAMAIDIGEDEALQPLLRGAYSAAAWICPTCAFASPISFLERWSIARCPGCGKATGIPAPHRILNREIRDPKLVARVRALIRAEHAGFFASYNGKRDTCIEPACTCGGDICGPFRDLSVRCRYFEESVLPLEPDLEAAYWAHLRAGDRMVARQCEWPGCRRDVASVGPATKYCAYHAEVSRKRSKREYSRRYRANARHAGPGRGKIDPCSPCELRPRGATASGEAL